MGYIPEEFAHQMDWTGTSFNLCEESKTVHLNPALSPGEDVVEACKQAFTRLCEVNRSQFNGCPGKWLSSSSLSFQAIRYPESPTAMFTIPTPLRGILGIATAGVHLNVYTLIDQQPHIWVSRRSFEAVSYPGLLDQIVAGGMDPEDGTNPWTTLEHEASEEAKLVLDKTSGRVTHDGVEVGIVQGPTRISFFDQKNRAAGADHGHIEPGVRFVFDLEVPSNFVPVPNEPEKVEGFMLRSMPEVCRDLLNDQWKPNSALTTLDFLLRKGFVEDGGDGAVQELAARLQRDLPMAIN